MKKITIDWHNNIVRYYIVNIVLFSIGGIFMALTGFFAFKVVSFNVQIDESRDERNRLQGEISYFNLARKLTANDVEEFNAILLQLIPESEDYFSIIASLERLSLYTGLDVTRYSIDLPEAGSDKFTLSIVGTVPRELLPQFLANYRYGTGRLVTIERMSINDNPEGNVSLTLNFYSRKVTTSNLIRVGSLSEADIRLMQDVKGKIAQGEVQSKLLQQEKERLDALKKVEEQQRLLEQQKQLSGTPIPTPTVAATGGAVRPTARPTTSSSPEETPIETPPEEQDTGN